MENYEIEGLARKSFENPDKKFFVELQNVVSFLIIEKPEVLEKIVNEIKLINLVRSAQSRIVLSDPPNLGFTSS